MIRLRISLIAGIAGLLLFAAPAHAVELCNDVQGADSIVCDSTEWILQDSGHTCEWSGLTIQCRDRQDTLCTYGGGKTCILSGVVTTASGTSNYSRETTGLFQIADAVSQFVKLSQWGLSILAVLSVLMFIWAGFQFLTAGGRGEKVESGKKIIAGTITGIIISFSAYVIVNFTVMALTGTTSKAKEIWAGPIALLFPGLAEQKPFSGDNSGAENRTNCRSSNNDTYDKGCSNHIYCADTGSDLNGDVAKIQKKLKELGCLNTVDACYGPQTLNGVRAFQLANNLSPSGEVDAATAATLFMPGPLTPTACTGADIGTTVSFMPQAQDVSSLVGPLEEKFSSTDPGCCIINSGENDLYCTPDVSAKTCLALNKSGANDFLPGKSCNGGDTNNRCGFCQSKDLYPQGADHNCFEYVSSYWCNNLAQDSGGNSLSFQAGTCQVRCSSAIGSQCRRLPLTTLR